MTFKYKLSKRLAMMRDTALILSAIAAFACVPGEDSMSGPSAPSLFSISANPGTILLQESFEDNALAGRGWYDNTSPATTTAQHLPGSTQALEVHFLAGALTPVAGGAVRHLFQPTPTLYVSYWVKYSANWIGSGRPYQPHEFLIMSDQDGDWDGPSNGWLVNYIEHSYQNGGIPRLAMQDSKAINTSAGVPPRNLLGVTEDRSTAGCNGAVEASVSISCFNMPPWYNDKGVVAAQPAFQPTAGPGYKGDWNHVEVYLELNSVVGGIGAADGVMQYWFNGALVIDRHDILFRTGARPTIKFHQLVIAPYIGDGSPVDQYMWIDDLTLGTGGAPIVPALVASVTVSPASSNVTAGQAVQLVAILKDGAGNVLIDRAVTWASSNAAAATVSATGQVTAVAAGPATISATSEGVQGTAAMTVTNPIANPGTVSSLVVSGVTDTSVTLAFTEVTDGSGLPASYLVRFAVAPLGWGTASDVALGTCAVPMGGLAIGTPRTCTVLGLQPNTAYGFQLIPFRGTLNVNAVFGLLSNVASGTTAVKTVPVASVTVSPASSAVTAGQTAQVVAILKDAAGNPLTGRLVTWASSAPAVATVNQSGLVNGLAAGAATVSAASEGAQGTAAMTVTNPIAANPGTVSNLAVSGVTETSATLAFTEVTDGSGLPASYLVRFAVAPLGWGTASDVALGTCAVPMSGLAIGTPRTCTVLGLQPNTAYGFQLITFRGTLNVNAVFGVLSNVANVTTALPPGSIASVTVSPATASVQVGQTVQLAATPKDASGTPLPGRTVTWASSAAAVATVNGSGLVTAVAAGSAAITATSEGTGGTAAVTVTAVPPAPPTPPGGVTGLTVASVTDSSVTLSFTEVTDGAGQPAKYDIRWAAGTFSWPSATDVTRGSCTVPMAGTAIGARRSCTVLGLAPGTVYRVQLVSFRGTLNVDAVFGGLSNVASGTTVASTAPVATVAVTPASASLALGTVQQFTATLKDANGTILTGRPVSWASSNPLVSTVSGSGLVTGVAVGTTTLTATSEGQSGSATIILEAPPPPPPPSSGVVFESDWSTGIGTAFDVVTDAGRWQHYWEFNGGSSVQLLSVVSGASVNAPGGRNALKVVQRGSSYAANVQQDNILPPSTDYYVRYYMRNDDNSSSGDHIVTVDTYQYQNLTFMRKYGGGSSWRFVTSLYGCGYTYPIGHWGPSVSLSNGVWYRFEYFVHFVDATHVQVHMRVYDAAGTQILGDGDVRQSDYGTQVWNGRNDWTFASYYAAGYSFCVNPAPMTNFGLGNNGQQGAADTGLPWYFAGVQIRTDRWPGP